MNWWLDEASTDVYWGEGARGLLDPRPVEKSLLLEASRVENCLTVLFEKRERVTSLLTQ